MMNKYIWLYTLLFLSNSFGQDLSIELSEKKFEIGKAIFINLEVKTASDDSIIFMPQTTSIQTYVNDGGRINKKGVELEILSKFTLNQKINNKTKTWSGRYQVTVWDDGKFTIPGPMIFINDSSFLFKDISFESLLMSSVKGVEIYDIKEDFADIPDAPFSFIQLFKDYWFLIIPAIILLVYFFLKKRKIQELEPTELFKAMSLKERTLLAIEALENEKLWEKEKLKDHFVELSYILRSYLTARYDISILEKTSHQTKLLLTKKGLNDDTVENIGRILSQSDMVKFAKSKPETVAVLRISTLAKQIIAETSPLEFDNVE